MKLFIPLIICLCLNAQAPLVILVNGQSNALSRPLDGQDCTPYLDNRIMTYSNGWHTANCDYDTPGFVGVTWLMLAKQIVDRDKRSVVIINGAEGGKLIRYFHPDNANYAALLNRVTSANLRPDIIIFYQGESDAIVGANGFDWRLYYSAIRDSWRIDYPTVDQFIVVQIQPGCGADPLSSLEIMTAQEMVRGATIISTEGIPQQRDHCHLSEAGMMALASRLGEVIKGKGPHNRGP